MTDTRVRGAFPRAEIYLLLAVLLREPPGPELLRQLGGIEPVWESEAGRFSRALLNLSRMAEDASPEAIEEEYHQLFIGVTRGELLPYASWYLTGCLHDSPLAELRQELTRLGIVRIKGQCEPEDHVAAIFETMALLVQEQAPQQRSFFKKFVDSWVARFLGELEKSATARLYRAVAVLGQEWLQLERSLFF